MLRAMSYSFDESAGEEHGESLDDLYPRPRPFADDEADRRPASHHRGPGRGPGRGPARSTGRTSLTEPRVRRGTLRIPLDAAYRLRGGHPWLFRDTLGDRPVGAGSGEVVELHDVEGGFVARGIYDAEGPIAVRVFTRDPHEALDSAAFLRRVRAAAQLRAQLLPIPGAASAAGPTLSAYRVIHGEGDYLPGITVDRYGEYLVVHLYSASLEPHLPVLIEALSDAYKPRGVYLQRRFRPLGGEGPREPAELVHGAVAPVELEVEEGGLRFSVDVTAPLSTGLFLDLRLGRQAVAARARGRKVLNLFSYTGALSLSAAAGGATEVVSVDLSARAHARARRNLTLSGLSEAGHEFITGDVMAVMARMEERRRHFDMVIIDPPAFSHSTGQGRDRDKSFSVQRDYRELVRASLLLCRPGAILCCVANAAKFSVEDLMNAMGDGAGWAKRFLRVVDQAGLPPDFPVPAGFPEGNYLKVLMGAVI
jgi:23S rRNA (cytosine1962-C5)-methyltransferase